MLYLIGNELFASAAIYPLALFKRGVMMVATTLKPPDLVDIADRGELPRVMEGGLPWIYFHRRNT